MAVNDPWATTTTDVETVVEAPAEEPTVLDAAPAEAPKKTAAKKAAPKKVTVEDDDDDSEFHPFTLSLKPHGGYDAPLLVLRGKTVGALADQLDGPAGGDVRRLMENAALASGYFKKVFDEAGLIPEDKPKYAKASGSSAPQKSAPPAAAQEAPGGAQEFCKHGEMRFESFVSKKGNFIQIFKCVEDDCDGKYLNTKK